MNAGTHSKTWTTGRLPWLALLALVASGCGAAAFERSGNAKKYRPLPLGATVRIVDKASELTQPVEEIGVLRTTTRGDPANRMEAEETFKTHALRYGCDAVADVQSSRREIQITKRTKTIGHNGIPIYTDEKVIAAEHDWTGHCLRTPDAPLEPGAPKVEAAPEPVKPPPPVKKGKQPKVEAKPEPKPTPKPTRQEPKVVARAEPKPEPKTPVDQHPQIIIDETTPVRPARRVEPAPEVKPEPKPEPRVEPKPEPRPEPKPLPKPEPAPVSAPPPPQKADFDPKVASEVARAFLAFSDAFVRAQPERICGMFDDNVAIDIQSSQPKLRIKDQLTSAAACQSLTDGELAHYVKDLGPAEVHAEMMTLIPSLFQLYGGAYLQLDSAQQKHYADALRNSRVGKKALACTMYNVAPAEDLFKVSLTCSGVTSFRVLLRRTAPDSFKVMQFTHVR